MFGNSLGVNTGPPSHVEIAFDERVAPYVRARVWHPSQALRDAADGGVVLTIDVCNDAALRSWILGWGPFARVSGAGGAAEDIRADLRQRHALNIEILTCARPFRFVCPRRRPRCVLFLGGPSLLRFYTDWLWFGEVGYQQVFTTIVRSEASLFTFVVRHAP